jgi:glycosyltransferase involved in cell wall biosynthesis
LGATLTGELGGARRLNRVLTLAPDGPGRLMAIIARSDIRSQRARIGVRATRNGHATDAQRQIVRQDPFHQAGDGPRIRAAFVMEQVLGHVTWYQNLRGAVTELDSVDADWIETQLFDEHGLIEHLPVLPSYVRAGLRARVEVRRALARTPADVLVFNTQKPAIFCQPELRRIPSILMTDVTPLQYDRMAGLYGHSVDANPLERLAKHWTNVLNFRLAKMVIPWSNWAADSVINEYGVPRERVEVIPTGLDTSYWQPGTAERDHERLWLLFVGGNFERKGGRLLLDVFRGLGLQAHAELHIVTRDPVEPTPGVVVHHNIGNNSLELLRLYQASDVFVLPTMADCFSNASIEAMAVGLPVIATNMGGIPDIVEHGTTGLLVEPADGLDLAAALTRLSNSRSDRESFGKAARERALRLFDARINAGRILELVERVHAEQFHRNSVAFWERQDSLAG